MIFVPLIHEGDCPYCKLPLVQNTKEMDYEVVVKFGNKKIEYRCVACVIADQGRYTADLIVYAPSEKPGEPVVLKRTKGKWTAPEKAIFVLTLAKHASCAYDARAFSTVEATKAKGLTLDQFLVEVPKRMKEIAK